MTTIALNKLKFGDDYPGGSINARKAGREDGLAELGATILDKGLIHALVIKTHGGKAYVGEGNRRLKAMRLLVKDGRLPKDWPVKVEEMAEDVDPLELSLTANIMQLPMHEVDQYEAFAQLRNAGKSPADIASSFGTSELVVYRRLALGSLSPHLREAWRENRIRTEVAQAFTIVQDHELQDQVYASLAKGQMLQRHAIIRALTRSDIGGGGDLRFVGRDAYLAAGGRLHDDLFAEEAHVLDGEILKRLEREKIDAACRDLVAQGWGWAALASDLPNDRYKWPKAAVTTRFTEEELFRIEQLQPIVEATGPGGTAAEFKQREAARAEAGKVGAAAWLRSFSADDKALSGCVLRVGYDGELSIEHGIVRPGGEAAGPAPDPTLQGTPAANGHDAEQEEGEASSPEISGVLAQLLSEQLTAAAANAIADEPDTALRVLVAAFQCFGSPARIGDHGWHGLGKAMVHPVASRTGSFADAFASAQRSSMVHLKAEIASRVAASLDMTEAAYSNPGVAVRGRQQLIDALDPDGYLKAARQTFDGALYFDRAPAAIAIAAVEEMGGPKPTGRKGQIALAAATLAEQVGWLPPMLRSCHYVPPRVAEQGAANASSRGRASRTVAPGAAAAP